MTVEDWQLAAVSELAARYFNGWKPKQYGERRFPAFESRVRQVMEHTPDGASTSSPDVRGDSAPTRPALPES